MSVHCVLKYLLLDYMGCGVCLDPPSGEVWKVLTAARMTRRWRVAAAGSSCRSSCAVC